MIVSLVVMSDNNELLHVILHNIVKFFIVIISIITIINQLLTL